MNHTKLPLVQRAPAELYVRQMELEAGMREAGIQRYRKNVEKCVKGNREDETSYGNRLIGTQLAGLAEAIEQAVELRISGSRAGAGCAATPLIAALGDYKKAAYLTLKAVVGGLTKEIPQATVCVKIGMTIEDEIRCSALKEQDKQSYKNMLKAVAKKGDYRKKRDTELYINRAVNLNWKQWSDTTRFKVGIMLLDCLFNAIPEFVEVRTLASMKKGSTKTTNYLVATESTMRWVEENKEFMQGLNPVYEPMVVPPVEWKEGMVMGGGYISNAIRPLKLVKVRSAGALEAIRHAKMDGVYRALNAAQDTAWRIRQPILEMLEHCYKNNLALGGLSLQPESPLPLQPNKELEPEAHAVWRSAAKLVYESNLKLANQKMSIWNNMTTARKYAEFERIYMPWQLDFRGRIYCVTNLSPQGEDYVKALLEFAESRPLGNEEGVRWLFIHVANLYGIDKVSFDERVEWTTNNLDALIAVCDDPMTNRMWEEADSPWQALAASYELKGYREHGYAWESRMPVALDGSCSGLQNLGMALACEVTGKSVNLLPSDKPADIYREVANKVIVMLKENCDWESIESGKETIAEVCVRKVKAKYFESAPKPSEKKWLNMWNKLQSSKKDRNKDEVGDSLRKLYSQVRESHAWLLFGVDRSTAKRSVMTFPYGSEEYGFKEQVMEDTLRPAARELIKTHGVTSAKELPKDVWPFHEDGFMAASVLAHCLFVSVRQTVLKAAEAMKWMQDSARMVAKQQRPITWRTPLGFPVTQEYRKLKVKRVSTIHNGTRYDMSIAESQLAIDVVKSANSISPNVVHSLDSSHLMLTVANAADEGMNSFALIHDSFGVHAGDTQRFFMLIRESFHELYTELDVFAELKEQFDAQLPPDEVTPELPIYGNLDREAIKTSLYAFA